MITNNWILTCFYVRKFQCFLFRCVWPTSWTGITVASWYGPHKGNIIKTWMLFIYGRMKKCVTFCPCQLTYYHDRFNCTPLAKHHTDLFFCNSRKCYYHGLFQPLCWLEPAPLQEDFPNHDHHERLMSWWSSQLRDFQIWGQLRQIASCR